MDVFRAMKVDAFGKPDTGTSRRTLGVKPGSPNAGDIAVSEGRVMPRTGGMSVAPDNPINLPNHRRPKEFDGDGRDPVFRFKLDDLPETLSYRQDQPNHGLIEPNRSCTFDEYLAQLHKTKDDWEILK